MNWIEQLQDKQAQSLKDYNETGESDFDAQEATEEIVNSLIDEELGK